MTSPDDEVIPRTVRITNADWARAAAAAKVLSAREHLNLHAHDILRRALRRECDEILRHTPVED